MLRINRSKAGRPTSELLKTLFCKNRSSKSRNSRFQSQYFSSRHQDSHFFSKKAKNAKINSKLFDCASAYPAKGKDTSDLSDTSVPLPLAILFLREPLKDAGLVFPL